MKLVAPLIIVVVLGLLIVEAAMQPTSSDRLMLYTIFGGVALLASAVAGWMSRGSRFRSLRTTLQVLAVSSVLVAAVAVAVSAWSMVINTHDLRIVLIALGLGVALGVTLAITVTGRLTDDLNQLVATVRAVGDGDLTVSTGIDRIDEVGETARQVDAMIVRLAEARAVREKDEAARREFLAAIGHDLRTPLTAMRVAIEAIEDGLVEDPDRYLKSMKTDIDTLAELIDDLAVLTSFEAGGVRPYEHVDVAELADETVEALAPLAAASGVSVRVGGSTPVPVRGDPAALGRVLRNLVDNALRYAPDGSVVEVSATTADGFAHVSVADEGPGFPPDLVSRAFDRFATDDPSRRRGSGTGLGLAIAKSVVEAHGGSIWIDRDAPGGSVSFRIPTSPPGGG